MHYIEKYFLTIVTFCISENMPQFYWKKQEESALVFIFFVTKKVVIQFQYDVFNL